MGRVKAAAINITFGYIGTFATAIMSFILRTIFIRNLSAELLGVNDLYTNILSLLSMAELGIGTALNFSLYVPVARGDKEKIKSYMQLYRRAYYAIAMIIAVIGLALAPFLKYLIKDPGNITTRDLTIYYLIFLFNTVTSYFVAYKYSLVNAEQKNYIQTNVNTVTKIITVLFQIGVVVVTKNFYFYLLTDAAVQLLQKIFVNYYLNRLYPYLREKKVERLTKQESGEVWTKTRALLLHKVGDVARLQTSSLMISALISVSITGVVSNYNLIINTVSNFVNTIFNSVISSFGNLIATETKEKQFEMFQIYRFFAAWVYGYAATGFFVLITPVVRIWLGDSWVLPGSVVFLILADFYFKGDRVVLSNYKTAAGVFEPDKYLTLVQGAVNIVLGIVLAQLIGLEGIYIGTLVSGLIANIAKPVIIYRYCFDRSALSYFADTVKHLLTVAAVTLLCMALRVWLIPQNSLLAAVGMAILITVLFNGTFFLLYRGTPEFQYLYRLVRGKVRKSGRA
ncbi:MAG: polysaccharide biosynthesis protein [Eubacteriales bacterium]|nr:polysaccharide biosynthesis protein [Eubacteriales bacterium]